MTKNCSSAPWAESGCRSTMTELIDRAPLRKYFPDSRDTLVSACLEGHMGQGVLGEGWGLLLAGDFAFLAGRPDIKALQWLDAHKKGYLILSGSEEWLQRAEGFRSGCRSTRYAFEDDPVWNMGQLHQYAATLPDGIGLAEMNENLFSQCRQIGELRDLCSAFSDMKDFSGHGAGVLAVRNGRPVAGASAYAWDSRGIEVEIDTLPAYRRRGLATACGAALVLICLEKGLRVHWDAANETSLRLAKRLGFGEPRPYEVIEWP